MVDRRRDCDPLQCLSVSSFKIGVDVFVAGRFGGARVRFLFRQNTCFWEVIDAMLEGDKVSLWDVRASVSEVGGKTGTL